MTVMGCDQPDVCPPCRGGTSFRGSKLGRGVRTRAVDSKRSRTGSSDLLTAAGRGRSPVALAGSCWAAASASGKSHAWWSTSPISRLRPRGSW